MTIREEVQFEEYKRAFAEAYKQGFIDAMSVYKDEPQYNFGDFADRLWEIAYERGKREALEQTENNSEKPNNSTSSKMEQAEPQLTPNYCGTCKHREVSCGDLPCDVCHGYSNYEPKDEPQTDCAWNKGE